MNAVHKRTTEANDAHEPNFTPHLRRCRRACLGGATGAEAGFICQGRGMGGLAKAYNPVPQPRSDQAAKTPM